MEENSTSAEPVGAKEPRERLSAAERLNDVLGDAKEPISSRNLKRSLEDAESAAPLAKEAKNDQSPATSAFLLNEQSIKPPTLIQPVKEVELQPEKNRLFGAGSLATLVAGTASVLPGEVINDPVLTVGQAQKLGELLDLEYAQQLAAEEEEDNADVAAVLGDCSDKECSYQKGYMKRQALYSCLTCYKKTNEVAGICLACTYNCHDGHDFVELYTKRNFRCDCGNSKFTGLECKLTPAKDILNERNQYNQNFVNAYCVCHRPYPDPDPTREEMIQVQCTFCEDWFHLPHVLEGAENMDLEAMAEIPKTLVCQACRQKHSFVNYYIAEEGDLVGEFDATLPECQIDGCGLKFLQKKFDPLPAITEAGWTPLDWYTSVCTCHTCKKLYADEKVEFLLDADESVAVYEEKGRAKVEEEKRETIQAILHPASGSDALQECIQGLERVQQIEFATVFADLKRSLASHVHEIASRGEIVQVEHVQAFFEEERRKLEERKQQRGSGDGI